MTRPLVSHIGIAVRDLEQAVKTYALITGDTTPVIEDVLSENVKVAIFSAQGGGGRVELAAATSADSPIAKFIKKHGEGLHHICIYVDDIKVKLAELKKAGIRLIDETHRTGAEGKKIAFVHPESFNGVLIEIEERGKE